ncbi:MAG: hypothetical protein U9N32_08325 [Spirochaetota bacterium]|nr:hypothetical protein [Spirochaetota bacterium]
MAPYEPECVLLRRRGAEYVMRLLSDKNREEELKFWSERTKQLRSLHKTNRVKVE